MIMKQTIYKSVGTFAATASLLTASSMAGTPEPPAEVYVEPAPSIEGELHVGYANMYEFRFVDQGNDLTTAGLDLAYDAGVVDLSVGAWYATWDAPAAPAANNEELDLYGGISYDVTDDFSVEVGHITYLFFDGGTTTNEFYVSASYALPYDLSISSTYFYDYSDHNGSYVDTSLSYSYAINDSLGADFSAGFGYADGHNLQASTSGVGTEDGFQGYYLSAALPWEFREGVTLTPYVKYTDGDSGLLTNLAAGDGQDFLIAGVTLAVGF